MLWITKMRVAALYLVATAFVIAMSTPGPHPYVTGGAEAVSLNSESITVATRWDDAEFKRGAPRRPVFDTSLYSTVSINSAAFEPEIADAHPAAKRFNELRSLLASMEPPARSADEIEYELTKVRALVDDRQKVFDGLASELNVLREELSQMDRREAATEIAERIDATQNDADKVRSALVHSLVALTGSQAELRNARRYEDMQSELIALEEMMISVRSLVDIDGVKRAAPVAEGAYFSEIESGFAGN